MKKRIIALFILALIEISIYIFIPGDLIVSKLTTINCTLNGATRQITNVNGWDKGWADSPRSVAAYFHITRKLSNGADIVIGNQKSSYPSTIELFAKGSDSLFLEWRCHLISGLNPINRIRHYFEAVRIKKIMDTVVENLRLYLANQKNIYGMEIHITSTRDTALIATKKIFPYYPSTTDIYGLLSPLHKYIAGQGAEETGRPMLNITKLFDNRFEIMVAIPTSRELPSHGNIFSNKLIPGGFMVADIRGGQARVDQALDQMHLYFGDYNKTTMAIPFQSLITDRSMEPDTSKWVTRIYAPVMR